MSKPLLFDLWVPRTGLLDLAPRSALVSSQDQTGPQRRCYFEGNLYGASNMTRYAERVMHAAGRAVQRYPTVAFGFYDVAQLQPVGTYDSRSRRIVSLSDTDALAAYLSPEPVPVVLTASEARRRMEAALRGVGVAAQTHDPLWQRWHAWTGQVRPAAGGTLFECVTLDGTGLEWIPGLRHLPGGTLQHLAHGLRHILDQE